MKRSFNVKVESDEDEEQSKDKYKPQMEKLVKAHAKLKEFKNTINIHTSLLPAVFLILCSLTAFQFLFYCEVELFDFFYHHRYNHLSEEYHRPMLDLHELLEMEHPLDGFHDDMRNEAQMREERFQIEMLVQSNWIFGVVRMIVYLNLVAVVSLIARCYFYLNKKTFFIFLGIMFIITLTAICQLLAVFMRTFWLFYDFNILGLLAIFFNVVLFLLDLVTIHEINEIRNLTIYFAFHAKQHAGDNFKEVFKTDINIISNNKLLDLFFCCFTDFNYKKEK